jgi:N-acyl-D-aspartate/D-glutamate deacylase
VISLKVQIMKYLLLALTLLLGGTMAAEEPVYDLVIRNGRVIDGTGNPWFHADVAVKDGKIVALERILEETGRREIDAQGMVVAPGFIDMHSHSDYLLLEDGDALSKIHQGVTTEILGEGYSAGPNKGKRPARSATVHGKTVRWNTLGEYFQVLEKAGISTNVASYVGLNNAWEAAMGRSFDRPSEEQFMLMEQVVREAMEDGALGLSCQVMMPPGSLATTDDVIRLAQVTRPFGGTFSTHIRNEGTGVFRSIEDAIRVAEEAGVPVDIIHLKIADEQYWGRMQEIVDLIEAARARNVNVQANVYPYTRGNNNLVSIMPPWVHEGGRKELIKRLGDPEMRKRIKHDVINGVPGWYNHYTAVGGDWGRMLVAGNNRFKGLTMDRVMALRTVDKKNADLLDELMDFLVEEGGSVSTVYAHHTEKDMNLALQQPWCSVGSDGAAYAIEGPLRRGNPHPRNFGTFPRVLGYYVREQHLLSLEDAIRKMTSLNADKVGLQDRGRIARDFNADITIFDPQTVIDKATYTEPFQYCEGIIHVIVNGTLVLEDGKHTGKRPGMALRRP